MNWQALGAIGEVVGGVAVIGVLINLSSQIRQNTKINRSTIRQNFYDYTARQMLHGGDIGEFSALLAKVAMTDHEKCRQASICKCCDSSCLYLSAIRAPTCRTETLR